MAATATSAAGSAERWGPIWGERAEEWARVEEQQLPTYEEALRHVPPQPGDRVLDVGCGTGVFLAAVAARGVAVSGLDASPALLEVARRRIPGADLRTGDMERLPYEDGAFDLVTGFNSFFFADDLVAALREAGRVARGGATVLVQVWGNPERCELDALHGALAPFLPPRPAGGPGLWRPGALERLAREAGLTPRESFETRWAFTFASDDHLARGLMSAANAVLAVAAAGEEQVREAIVGAFAGKRAPDGGYRLANEWRFLLATAP